MLKLYRDFLFHQVDENGMPWIDMAHIIQSLNKVKCHGFVCFVHNKGVKILTCKSAFLAFINNHF